MRAPVPRSRRHAVDLGAVALSTMGLVVALTAVGALIVVARMPRMLVEGRSMQPTLEPGDRLLVARLTPRAGGLVVLTDPRQPSRLLVKRVVSVARERTVACEGTVACERTVTVAGDNPEASTDSRHFGPVPLAQVRGRPVYRYDPRDRAGWVWDA